MLSREHGMWNTTKCTRIDLSGTIRREREEKTETEKCWRWRGEFLGSPLGLSLDAPASFMCLAPGPRSFRCGCGEASATATSAGRSRRQERVEIVQGQDFLLPHIPSL